MKHPCHTCRGQGQKGFTLIELMVAMVLGLVVIAGVVSIFLASQRVYRANAALGEMQDNARVAFEMMARDIRQTGVTGCVSTSPRMANVLDLGPHGAAIGPGGVKPWWADWENRLHGYRNDDAIHDPAILHHHHPAREDSIQLVGAGSVAEVVRAHDPAAHTITLRQNRGVGSYDVVLICDLDHTAMLQLDRVDNAGHATVLHYMAAHGAAGGSGNCSTNLGYPTHCPGGAGHAYQFRANAQLSRLSAVDWYICHETDNPQELGLCRLTLRHNERNPLQITHAQEVVPHVTAMHITYHQQQGTDFEPLPRDWSTVSAVRVELTMRIRALTKTFAFTTYVRNWPAAS